MRRSPVTNLRCTLEAIQDGLARADRASIDGLHDETLFLQRARDGGSVQVEVTDSGAGIHADHLPHVFDRFYRADRSRSRATGGAGLGLAIARQLVTAHGGAIEAVSDGQDGARRSPCACPGV